MPTPAAPTPVYVGSYGPKGRGIYRFALDPATGALSEQGLTPSTRDPSWLLLDAAGRRLYSADEAAGSISSYAVGAEGGLQLLGTQPSGGTAPVHLSLHPQGRHLFVVHYGSATVAVLPVLEDDGRAGAPLAVQAAPARYAPGPQRAVLAPPGSFAASGHEAAHMHMAAADPGGRFVLACDLGLDLLIAWRFDAATGRLLEPEIARVAPGAGPRHFAFHPHRPELVYVLNEAASTLAWLHLDAHSGRLTVLGETSSLPTGFKGTSYASGLLFAPEGRQLYALNRLHDSVAIFDIGHGDGRPQLRSCEWTRGAYPRSAALAPGGRWLLVCNQHSDHVAVFERRAEDGGLAFSGHDAAVGSPAGVAVVPG